MSTVNLPGSGPSQQEVDANTYDVGIVQTKDKHVMNVDLMVQMVFLQYNQLMNLRTQDKLDQTKDTLSEMSKAREMYNQMKELKNQAKEQGGVTAMPQDMIDFLKQRGIKWDTTGNDYKHNPDEWDINMSYLDSYTQKISGQNKTQMLELNQCVEDGNNALREVSTVFAKAMEVLQSIIQTINR